MNESGAQVINSTRAELADLADLKIYLTFWMWLLCYCCCCCCCCTKEWSGSIALS